MLWDIFCRVVDNLGDAGVCWRLSCDLASRGETVRLWIDEPAPLAWMAPEGCAGVNVIRWAEPLREVEPGDVVIEAFGCDPPAAFVARMAQRDRPPAWINLEYLSAEAYVERCHGLSSPQSSGPGMGLVKRFFYPGFTPATGGLICERDLMREQERFDRSAWLRSHGIATHGAERLVSLFCYDNAALPWLLERLTAEPTLLLAAHGAAADQVRALLGPTLQRGMLRAVALSRLTQTQYDRLLWSCDMNLVRGEDSFVRAQWAGTPFVWQAYPQQDGAHAGKLGAFLDRFLDGAEAQAWRALFAAWNGLAPPPAALPQLEPWQAHCQHWRDALLAQADLTTQLIAFAQERAWAAR